MSRFNIHMTPAFEKSIKSIDFSTWIGLAKNVPVNPKPRFKSDDDLWK